MLICLLLFIINEKNQGVPVWDWLSLAQNPSRLGSVSHCESISRKAAVWVLKGFTMAVRFAAFLSFRLTRRDPLVFAQIYYSYYFTFPQGFPLKPPIVTSHLMDHPCQDTHCHFSGTCVCQKTLIALWVRILNCNTFMYAAAPLPESKFYLLIN